MTHSKPNDKLDANSPTSPSADESSQFAASDPERNVFRPAQIELGDSICSLLNKARDGCSRSHSDLLEQLRTYVAIVAASKMNAKFQAKFGESDVVQQSLAVAIEKFDDFRGNSEGELFAWVKTILQNELRQNQRALLSEKRDMFRERSMEPPFDSQKVAPHLVDNLATPGTRAVKAENEAAVNAAMQNLPAEYRQVIHLRNWEKLSFREVGQRMNRSANAVTKLWYRALIQLKRELEQLDVREN